jgi:hypothetical protein
VRDGRVTLVALGTAVRLRAVKVADEARAAGSCGHPGARFSSGLDPGAGRWCVACGAAHIGDLLTHPWCALCPEFARPGLTSARSESLEVLLRVCDRCLTLDPEDDDDQDDGPDDDDDQEDDATPGESAGRA